MSKPNTPQYLNPRQFAAKVNLTRQRINQLLLAGKIAGAVRVGAMWLIPADFELPK